MANGTVLARAGAHSRAVFHELIRRERLRADREGTEFSLLILGRLRDVEPATLIRGLADRMRVVDEVGWVSDDADLGVLLPATALAGACEFAQAVRKRIALLADAVPPLAVYSYPTNWFQDTVFRTCRGEVSAPPVPRHRTPVRRLGACDDGSVTAPNDLIESILIDRVPAWKRALDVVGSLVGLVAFSPVFLLAALYIRLVSPGPVIFRQKRVGRTGALFTLLKFRTMKENNDQGAHAAHVLELIRSSRPAEKLDSRGDTRIIPGGRILRRSCIDELPQLVNVLRGEMSLVGPRPCMPYEAEVYSRWQSHRFDILPGMSGLWQVNKRSCPTFPDMIRLDIQYARHMSLLQDIWIIVRTPPAIVQMAWDALRRRFAGAPQKAEAHNGSIGEKAASES